MDIVLSKPMPALAPGSRAPAEQQRTLAGTLAVSAPAQPLARAANLAAGVPAVPAVPAVQAVHAAQASAAVEREPLEQAVSSMRDFVQTISRDLNFAVDDSSGRMVVKVTDGASGEVIRQMPSEEALRLAESLDDVRSLLFKAQA
jgi:flagellar protein FlaG